MFPSPCSELTLQHAAQLVSSMCDSCTAGELCVSLKETGRIKCPGSQARARSRLGRGSSARTRAATTLRADRRIINSSDCRISQIFSLARSEVPHGSIAESRASTTQSWAGLQYFYFSELVCAATSLKNAYNWGCRVRGGKVWKGETRTTYFPAVCQHLSSGHLPLVGTTPLHGLVAFLPANTPPQSPPHLPHHHSLLPLPSASPLLPLRRCLPTAA